MEERIVIIAVLKPLAIYTIHNGECRFKCSLKADKMLFKGFGQSCGEYSSAEIQNEMFFKY